MRIWLSVVSMLLCIQTAWAQAPQNYPDVPPGDPAYADLTTIYNSSLLIECVYGFTGKLSPMSRYDFAVATARLIQNIPPLERASNNSPALIARRTPIYTALARLLVQFAPELHTLGISHADLAATHFSLTGKAENIKDYATTSPFNDVPPGHWAFNAVERLRLNGIIVGQAAHRTDVPSTKKPKEQGQPR